MLKQLYGAQEQGAITITEPADCTNLGIPLDSDGGCAVPANLISGSNPDLKAEKGKTWNLGVIVDLGAFSGSLDYWKIEKKDAIGSPTISSAIEQGFFVRESSRYNIFTNLQNFAEVKN